jgi:hypothetical protein
MYIHVTDDRLRYIRSDLLAHRMMAHRARPQTISRWTGLSLDQLVTRRQRWGFAPARKDPSPSAFHKFFRSRRLWSEAAIFASLCRISCAIPERACNTVAARWPALERGEKLCEAFEAFREWAETKSRRSSLGTDPLFEVNYSFRLSVKSVVARKVDTTQGGSTVPLI